MATDESTDSLHVVMFPWFAYGHISPFVQLSNKLSLHGVKVSFLSTPSTISRINSTINLNPRVLIIPISIPHIEGIPPGLETTSDMTPAMAELLKQAADLMQPQINTLLSQLKPHFVFFDFVYYWLPYLASQLGIKTLYFSVYSAISDNYNLALSRRNNHTIHDFMKPPTGFPTTSLTSLTKFEAGHSFYVVMNFDGHPSVYDRALEGYNGCSAILMKTCNEMEGPYVEYKKTQFQKPILLTGPIVSEPPSGELDERWSKWLVHFPPKSVIFCSFGSETFLSNDQVKELALGLELTGLPFFLVVNFPANVDAEIELVRALPEGLMERVKDRAVVHTGWIQQQLILAHNSVGCYVCHSGFSSVLEAIMHDCQLVLLPCKGDQFLNVKLIAGDRRAGVEVNRREDDGYFDKEDILEAVKTVMVDVNKEPGMCIRENHKKWREFLMNKEIENRFIADLVKDLKDLA